MAPYELRGAGKEVVNVDLVFRLLHVDEPFDNESAAKWTKAESIHLHR